MKDIWIRRAGEEDTDAIAALATAAFGSPDEAAIIARLQADGDSLYSLVAHDDRQLLGHIQFFAIAVDGADIAAGLGPMVVEPSYQHRGIGTGLVRFGLSLMQGSGRDPVFVLGHPDYYPRFGFSAEAASGFTAPWGGAVFMALRASDDAPCSGTLTYPAAFGS